jgi:hypothetical protein
MYEVRSGPDIPGFTERFPGLDPCGLLYRLFYRRYKNTVASAQYNQALKCIFVRSSTASRAIISLMMRWWPSCLLCVLVHMRLWQTCRASSVAVHDASWQPTYALYATAEEITVNCCQRLSVVFNGTLPGPPLYLKEEETTWVRVYNRLENHNLTMVGVSSFAVRHRLLTYVVFY